MNGLSIIFILLFSNSGFADCAVRPDAKIKIPVKSCVVLDPNKTPELYGYKGQFTGKDRKEFLNEFYRGALIETETGEKYVYPTSHSQPCDKFPATKEVEKMGSYTCCDTGPWGKCIFGGSFLYDIGSKKINTFQ